MSKFIAHSYGYSIEDEDRYYSLKKNNFSHYGGGPKNICQLTVYTVFAILMFPVSFPAFIANCLIKNRYDKVSIYSSVVLFFFCFFVGSLFLAIITKDPMIHFDSWYFYYLVGLLFLCSVMVAVSAILFGVTFLCDKLSPFGRFIADFFPAKKFKCGIFSKIFESLYSYKKKICKDIEWVD